MKKLSLFFFWLTFSSIHAQENIEDFSSANKEIYILTDSLWSVEKMYQSKAIDEKTYLAISGELLNAISTLAYSNASNYTRPQPTEISQENSMETLNMEAIQIHTAVDTVPTEQNMEEMPEFTPPQTPINLITGSGRRTSFKIRYGMYWNGLSQGNKNSTIEYPEFKVWSSYCWFSEFDILLQTRLGKSNRGPLSLYYGIGWDIRQYTQKENPQQLSINQEDKAVFITPLEKLDKASLDVGYFRIPIGLQYKKHKMAINVGGYLGFLTRHSQTLESKTSIGEEEERTLDKNYNFTKTNYGISASIGFKHVHLAFNYDLNTLFKDNDDYEYNAWKIGLMLF